MKLNNRILELAGQPLQEGKYDYETYHKTYTSAVQEARKIAKLKGYEIDGNSWFTEVNTGPGKPSEGKTVKHSITLLKNGKKQKKALQIQVYGMETGAYELNTYILWGNNEIK